MTAGRSIDDRVRPRQVGNLSIPTAIKSEADPLVHPLRPARSSQIGRPASRWLVDVAERAGALGTRQCFSGAASGAGLVSASWRFDWVKKNHAPGVCQPHDARRMPKGHADVDMLSGRHTPYRMVGIDLSSQRLHHVMLQTAPTPRVASVRGLTISWPGNDRRMIAGDAHARRSRSDAQHVSMRTRSWCVKASVACQAAVKTCRRVSRRMDWLRDAAMNGAPASTLGRWSPDIERPKVGRRS